LTRSEGYSKDVRLMGSADFLLAMKGSPSGVTVPTVRSCIPHLMDGPVDQRTAAT
jgi:hypothetical protein